MKISRSAGLLCILLSIASAGFGQGTLDLDVRIRDLASVSGMLPGNLVPTSPLRIGYTGLNDRMEEIITRFENSGYPFVQVRIDSASPVPTGLNGILWINPGERVIIDTIMNRTGFRISQPVLYRLINIHPGDLYREQSVKEASSRLGQLAYLQQVRPPEVGFHGSKASVYLYPEKSGANRFDGWVGLSPNLKNAGQLAFSGALSLNLFNIVGQGEDWLLDWKRNQDASQKLVLGAHIPYLIGLPVGFQGRFELYRQDTSYLNINWDAGIPYHFSPRHLLTLFLRHRESSILTQGNQVQTSSRQPFTSLLSGISWNLNHLDNPVNPYKGLEISLEASVGKKSIPDSAATNQSEFSANISWYQPLAKNLTCALLVQSGYINSPEIYENELYRMGGLNRLRGFDEDVFRADAYGITSLEIRYLLDRWSHLLVLADLGFLRAYENSLPVVKTPAGFGLGGQIRTGGGIFRIIFALGKESGLPLNLKNSKIHLGYVGVF